MQIKISFLGAAQNVTGSRYLVEANGSRVLVDCGFYQEREFAERNWDPFPFPPAQIDAVLLTHAHLDHCGLLPKLVREGFRGPIHCTAATAEIAQIILLDSAHIQEEDAAYKQKRHRREKRKGPHPVEPLYTTERRPERPAALQARRVREEDRGRQGHDCDVPRRRARVRLVDDHAERPARRRDADDPVLRRRGPTQPADPPGPDDLRQGRLRAHREHLRRPRARADRGHSREAGRGDRPDGGRGRQPRHPVLRARAIAEHPVLPVRPAGPQTHRADDGLPRQPDGDPHHRGLQQAPRALRRAAEGTHRERDVAVQVPGPDHDANRRGVQGHQPHPRHGDYPRGLGHVHGRPNQAPPRQQHRTLGEHDPVRRLPGQGHAGADHLQRRREVESTARRVRSARGSSTSAA